MLVLSRKAGQSLTLTLTEPLPQGSKIEVLIARLGAETVRVGLSAPRSVEIVRSDGLAPTPITTTPATDDHVAILAAD